MSEDFGSYLKHGRELRGISLEEIALSTKISIRFLQALEENRFDDLPGEVFIKGFIRSYGQAIGSNVDELMAAYHEASGPPPQEEDSSESTVEEAKPAETSNPVLKMVLGFGAALAIIGAGIYWTTTQKDSTPTEEHRQMAPAQVDSGRSEAVGDPESDVAEPERVAEEEAPLSETDAPQTSAPSETGETPASEAPKAADQDSSKNTVTVSEKVAIMKDLQEQVVPPSGDSFNQTVLADQSLRLVIRVNENSWFNLTVDDQRDQDFILPAGGSKTIDAKNAIVMTIGNRRATQLALNGQPLEIPESPDNVIRNFTVNTERLN